VTLAWLRFDLVAWIGLPDERGRPDLFEQCLRGLQAAIRSSPRL